MISGRVAAGGWGGGGGAAGVAGCGLVWLVNYWEGARFWVCESGAGKGARSARRTFVLFSARLVKAGCRGSGIKCIWELGDGGGLVWLLGWRGGP